MNHSSLSKHLKVLDYGIIKRIFEVIVGKLRSCKLSRNDVSLGNIS
ncbi:hypothetical protein ACIQ57_01020 [Lysinibacillus xylanilyticus]